MISLIGLSSTPDGLYHSHVDLYGLCDSHSDLLYGIAPNNTLGAFASGEAGTTNRRSSEGVVKDQETIIEQQEAVNDTKKHNDPAENLLTELLDTIALRNSQDVVLRRDFWDSNGNVR